MIFERIQKENQDITYIYTTCSNREEAKSIAFSAIEEKLAVCTDFWSISSIYPWQNVIEEVDQYVLMLTTKKSFVNKLIKFIEGIHSYKIPFIAECNVQSVNDLYKIWANKTLKDNEKYISRYEKRIIDKDIEDGGYHPGKLK